MNKSCFFGFNGQSKRQEIFGELLAKSNFELIVETGTNIGETSAYMAETSGLTVFTCDIDSGRLNKAKDRFSKANFGIKFYELDSRALLKEVAQSMSNKRVFFYLDAHGRRDLPLIGEMETIINTWKNFIICIDDFEIPNDNGYKYDGFSEGPIGVKLISPVLEKHNLLLFFPTIKSNEENGCKCGSAWVASKGEMEGILQSLSYLYVFQSK